HARIGPRGQRENLRLFALAHCVFAAAGAGVVSLGGVVGGAAAALGVQPPLSKVLLSRNGCASTFVPPGGVKPSTLSASACGRSTWLRRRIGESPITS